MEVFLGIGLGTLFMSHIHSFMLNEVDKCCSRCGQVTEGIEVVTLEIVVYKASSSSSTH